MAPYTSRSISSVARILFGAGLAILLLASPAAPQAVAASQTVAAPQAVAAPPSPQSLGFVGNMFPTGGSTTSLTVGASFTVYVQVYKAGVTEPGGQGPNISCTLLWAPVGYFGGSWGGSTATPMTYNTQIGNNDEYKGTISPAVGLYEYTTYCTDLTDNSQTYQGNGNARLVVDTASGSCNAASQSDNTVYWNGLLHDSFSSTYRDPIGPVTTAQGTVTLKFRTCMDDLNAVPSMRVWNDRTNVETVSSLTFDSHAADSTLGGVTFWKISLPIPTATTALYYTFKATNGTATAYYRDDNPAFYGGGYGQAEADQTTAYNNSYQLTVYDPNFAVPNWMQQGLVYQIFPERFRDGDATNDPAAGRFSYNAAGGAIVRSNQSNWNVTMCDPRSTYLPACAGHYSDNFYGGDLRGVIQKLDQGYFDNLGVSVLYLNPIFRSPSNHKYDTADYMVIDPDFGTLADFQELATKAHAHGIKLILDGVFNHTSSDSKYFDRYDRYDVSGNLTSPSGVGTNDGSGACEAAGSTFRSWYYLPDIGTPGKDNGANVLCAPSTTYEAWYGYSSLPKLQANSAPVRSLIWNNGLSSVGPYWVNQGADGWRFDVGGDVDPGVTNDPNNDYWEGFRTAVRNVNPQTLTLGEEWGDATPWLLGSEWDSVMNYRFRSALLSWLFTGCQGTNGCSGGSAFSDNDANSGSSSGAISYISPSQFNARLRSIAEDYPPMALKAMMNLEGSHDTNRVRFLLKKANNDNDGAAVQRMKEWWIFSFTYPGAPTLYYGDEIGLSQDGAWDGSTYQDDPYNRLPFPWPDASGSSYSYDTNASNAGLQDFARKMSSIHWSYRALRDGDVQHGLIIDDANKLYGYARTYGTSPNTQTALIALNRDGASHTATFTGLNAAPYNLPTGTVLVNALDTTQTFTVAAANGGSISATVTPAWGVILLEQAKIDTPATVADLKGTLTSTSTTLTWSTVMTDTLGGRELVTSYTIHRDPTDPNFTPAAGNQTGTVTPSDASFMYGSTGGKFTFTQSAALAPAALNVQRPNAGYYYKVCALNALGVRGACTSAITPLAVTLSGFSATQRGNAIELAWETVSETDTAGYNLYRATGDGGPRVRLNAQLIPSRAPGGSSGGPYSYLDSADLASNTTYTYWLEDVSTAGVATTHAPIAVLYTGPNVVSLAALQAAPVGPYLALVGAASLVLALLLFRWGRGKTRRTRAD